MSGQDGACAAPCIPGQATTAAAAATVAAAMLGVMECRPVAMPQTGGTSAAATAAATALAALAAGDRPLTWRDKPLEALIDDFMAQCDATPESGFHPEAAGLGATDQPGAHEDTDSPRRPEHPSTDGPAAGDETAATYDQQPRRPKRLPLDLRTATPEEMREEIAVCHEIARELQEDRDRCSAAVYTLQGELDDALLKVARMGKIIEKHMAADELSTELQDALSQQVEQGEARIAQLTEALRSAGMDVPSVDPGCAAGDVTDPAPPEGAPSEQGGAERTSDTERQLEELRAALEDAHRGWAAAEAALEQERRRVPQQQQGGGGGSPDTRHQIRRLEAELREATQKEADHEEERASLRAQLEECEDELEACERDLAKLRVAHNAATTDYDYVLRINDKLLRMLDEQQPQQAAEQHSRPPTGPSPRTSVAGPVRYRVCDAHRTPSPAGRFEYPKYGTYRPPPSVTSTLSEIPEWLLGCPSQQRSSSHS
eukprot:TRINITY_DN7739_c0_g1_i1.p2 TRINITY_DN7739_c0_g1~~TRINITY_DN7739_c0_g1_i1.p2  ORF type:complete len:515 (+),score=166.82 TRINITY_DN7739_c0_g1_i1:89-1546(+)